MPTPILYCFDEGFVDCSLVSAFSLIQKTSSHYHIHFVHGKLSEVSAQKVKLFSDRFKDRVFVRSFDEGLPTVKGSHITNFTFARLMEIMRFDDRVLYIDGDTLILDDIEELLRLELDGYAVGAALCPTHLSWWYKSLLQFRPGHARNLSQVTRRLKEVNLNSLENYVNAGVMLIDTKRIRELGLEVEFSDFKLAAKYRWHDQDHINCLLNGRIKVINSKYNSIWGNLGFRNFVFPKAVRIAQREAITKPTIVHYAGKQKPWRKDKQRLSIKIRRFITHRKERIYYNLWLEKKVELDNLLSH